MNDLQTSKSNEALLLVQSKFGLVGLVVRGKLDKLQGEIRTKWVFVNGKCSTVTHSDEPGRVVKDVTTYRFFWVPIDNLFNDFCTIFHDFGTVLIRFRYVFGFRLIPSVYDMSRGPPKMNLRSRDYNSR